MRRRIMRVIAFFMLIITLGFILSSAMVTIYNPQILSIATADSATFDSVTTIDEPTASVTITTIPNTRVETTVENTTEPITVEEGIQPKTEKIEATVHIEETTIEIEQESKSELIENDTDYEFLLDTDNVDRDYTPKAVSLSKEEREEIARIVMGEFGGGGFTGCALIAQCIRDAMITYGYDGYNIRSNMQYYGYDSNPTPTVYEAIDWIFDGNAAVQHRILVMNNSSGGWHSTQNFVTNYQGVWFYDM